MNPIDAVIVVAYLLAMVGVGVWFMHRNKSSDDYFRGGGRLPWWVVSLSIYATLFSSITFLSIPALTYHTDCRYFFKTLGILVMVPIVVKFYLPFFRKLNLTSAYEYLEKRFNLGCRLFASAAFVLFMVARTAVVAYLPAVAIAAVTGIDVNLAIVIVTLITIVYCTIGGVEAVVWSDFVQSVILIGSTIAIYAYLVCGTDGGISGFISKGMAAGKFQMMDLRWNWSEPVLWVAIVGGLVENLASYTSDQCVVQRYMTTKDERGAAKSIKLNGILSFVNCFVFFTLGVALWTFYQSHADKIPTLAKADQIFPWFIAHELPVGFSGLVLAAVAAATMSTLSANLNSAATAVTTDFYKRLKGDGVDDRRLLRCGKLVTVVVGLLGGVFALVLANMDIGSIYDQFVKFLGVLTGGLACLFLMGRFMPFVNGRGAFIGLIANYVVCFSLDFLPLAHKPHLLLYGFFGMVTCLIVAPLASSKPAHRGAFPSNVSFCAALLAIAVAFLGLTAQAYGPWLELTPYGGVEVGKGEDRAALEAKLDGLYAECAGKPYIVWRTKALSHVFDHVRLAVNTNDLFVHWHPDSRIFEKRKERRMEVYRAADSSRSAAGGWMIAGGSYNSRLDTSHTCPDWRSVLALGPKGLAERARTRRLTAKTDGERLFLDCVAEVYEALARECRRWAEFAESKGMREVGAVLRGNAEHEPRTFREALQWALIYDRAQEVEGEDVRSQGLFDRLFIDYYRRDLAAGRETRESAKRLIADWYTRLWSQQHPNNKNISFGGYDAKGEPVWNELTELGFEVFRELGRINPKLTYRFGRKTPREQVEKVTRCLAEGKTSIVFAGEETLYETFRRRGKEAADLTDYVLVGCYEPGIGGREIIASMAADVNLAKPIETILSRPESELPKDAEAFEREYQAELKKLLDQAMGVARGVEEHWYEIQPAPLFSGAFRDCIETARDYSQGGCRYNSSGVVLIGIGTTADSLAAVRYLVDETRSVSMAELAAAMRANWKGYGTLQLKARRAAPKWGNNDERADRLAKWVTAMATTQVNAARNGHGGNYQAGLWSIYLDMKFGERTGATPDGRNRGETLSRNNVATAGCGTEGPTALMLSNLELDQAEFPDGHIMDVLLPASLKTSPNGARQIAELIAAYFAKGGQCLHLNCFDAKTLKDAYAHPERYPDLQVRVCGWNVRWADLSDGERRHFIKTAEAQER